MNEIQSRLKNIASGMELLAETMRLFANMMEGLSRSVQELADVGAFSDSMYGEEE